MDYKDFCKYLTGEFSELPINRKERFYTGTVLPAMLFHKGLSNFYHFLKEINGFPEEVNEQTTGDNFLFYTEYNLKESAGGRNVGRKISTKTNDTPDVIIEILKPKRAFIIIEAKMFHNVSRLDLIGQMNKQSEAVIEPLRKTFQLEGSQIFHIALVPEKSKLKDDMGYQIINWEFFINDKALNVKDNIFYNYLWFALKNYEKLVAIGPPPPPYSKKSGREIYEDGKNNILYWVGRQGGEKIITEKEITPGEWETYEYYVNQDKPSSGRKGNWITSKRFADLVDKYGNG